MYADGICRVVHPIRDARCARSALWRDGRRRLKRHQHRPFVYQPFAHAHDAHCVRLRSGPVGLHERRESNRAGELHHGRARRFRGYDLAGAAESARTIPPSILNDPIASTSGAAICSLSGGSDTQGCIAVFTSTSGDDPPERIVRADGRNVPAAQHPLWICSARPFSDRSPLPSAESDRHLLTILTKPPHCCRMFRTILPGTIKRSRRDRTKPLPLVTTAETCL